jgi:hypothetical protein
MLTECGISLNAETLNWDLTVCSIYSCVRHHMLMVYSFFFYFVSVACRALLYCKTQYLGGRGHED